MSWLHVARNARTLLKWSTLCFAVIIVILGITSQIIGGIIISHYKDYIDHVQNKYVAVAAFFVFSGVLVTVVGIVGIIGSFQQKSGVVTLFGTFLLIIFILELVAGALSLSFKNQVDDEVHKTVKDSLKNYSKDKFDKKFFNWVQNEFTCCGIVNSTDWTNSGQKIPTSCCIRNKRDVNCVKTRGNIYHSGCETQFQNFIRDNIVIIGGMALSIAILEVIGLVITFLFRKAIDLGAYEVI